MTEQPTKDLRDEIIGQLTVELAEERKFRDVLLSRLQEIREKLSETADLTRVRGW